MELARALGGLLLVVALIPLLAHGLRRLQGLRPGGAAAPLRIIAGLSVGTRERVLLIEAEGERLLIGVAPGQVRLLRHQGQSYATIADALPGAARTETAP
ncbi:MAG TPA: flagellar biosynthetic protein FliO [Nevskiaceae bacterium]|nr:flagellar biosynthetic protein FliO [Nevskiaceae bacterium]